VCGARFLSFFSAPHLRPRFSSAGAFLGFAVQRPFLALTLSADFFI